MKPTVPTIDSEFMASRLRYLSELPAIGEGWLSAGNEATTGAAPSMVACQRMVEVLTGLSLRGFVLTPATLVLGPIPAGGVAAELCAESGDAILNIFNHGAWDAGINLPGLGWVEHCGTEETSDYLCATLISGLDKISDIAGAVCNQPDSLSPSNEGR